MRPDPGKGWTNYQAASAEFRYLSLTLMQKHPSNSLVVRELASTSIFPSEVPSNLGRRHLRLTIQELQPPTLLFLTCNLCIVPMQQFSLKSKAHLWDAKDMDIDDGDYGDYVGAVTSLSEVFCSSHRRCRISVSPMAPQLSNGFFRFFPAYQVICCKITSL